MKTQELRLGNFVTPNGVIEFEDALDGFVHHVMGPSARLAVCAILSEKIIAVEAKFRGRMFQQKIDIDDVASIPLTEELLKKHCGFGAYYNYNLGYKCSFVERTYVVPGYGVFEVKRKTYPVGAFSTGHGDVYYLHQLQNLFFALTGEELDVKF